MDKTRREESCANEDKFEETTTEEREEVKYLSRDVYAGGKAVWACNVS